MTINIRDGHLRILQTEDLDMVLKWRNSNRVRLNMLSTHVITEEEHRSWFFNLDHNTCRYLVFEYRQRPVGLVNFTEIDQNDNRCSWGFYLGESDVPPGTGLLMGYLSMEYVFSVLNIRKLCSQVLSNNKKSINYHHKLGFKEEGRLLQHHLHNGVYVDVIVLALFKDNWEGRRDDPLFLQATGPDAIK
ncbi:UDP-4-amino-4,6-dideoxy-N-acetyl-beta-L-altrosamine N-acetyltransferase [Syntrophomonas wolfei]|jgi:UDP-4-amino-4,6-dideoxy-N-acetyl-beta-L-altrosamine N-acetyltransferase|uniref:UDP-4-amino-4, 6-dideoxy-N-acetyl-beta-L-altrosamine N-acetyltransferase n=1 Tax=Syntrophomonas wolfei TaxID=863 RepID=UPI00077375FB|nr:UDP-4-amino-4,6-dideoxy-N-acetyl-beta-L-altrosamine N-acetyltransferase [Syntrophomonas wolfei]